MPAENLKFAGVGDDAVRVKTGKNWKEWFAILDKAGARKMTHRDIAQYLYDTHKTGGWWSQMVTVGYEQARGMREKHERVGGITTSALAARSKFPSRRSSPPGRTTNCETNG